MGNLNRTRLKLRKPHGLTLTELLIVVAVVGILSAIVAPSWLSFLARQQVESGQGQVRLDVQEAQLKAQQKNVLWQFSIREKFGVVETSVHPATAVPSTVVWNALNNSIQIDQFETTLLSSDSVYYVRFDEKGNVRKSRRGRVTLSSKKAPDIKRCVFISTLLGATRAAKEQSNPDRGGRFCY